ncbi:MAG TPA: pyrroline-5-carboxylate reductase [Azospirillaceae bacterium]|nr:pyrroline-5-carboxylate reductase [Azospirillaceae bacterium]
MSRVGSSLLLVGCGKMGGAMLEGWLKADQVDRVVVVEPHDAGFQVGNHPRVLRCSSVKAVPAQFSPDVVVLAVKPQTMDQVVPDYAGFTKPGTLFLSIAAGKTLGWLEARLGDKAAIVRAMPNTPAAIGRGMSVCCPNDRVSPLQIGLAENLLRAVGDVAWVEEEELMDAVTAVSGSGPAYVFLLVEAMAQAGLKAGLPPDLAVELARATVAGAGELLHRSNEPAATLRRNVTSPGGTTEAALDVLMAEDGIQPLFDKAIANATARSRELAR